MEGIKCHVFYRISGTVAISLLPLHQVSLKWLAKRSRWSEVWTEGCSETSFSRGTLHHMMGKWQSDCTALNRVVVTARVGSRHCALWGKLSICKEGSRWVMGREKERRNMAVLDNSEYMKQMYGWLRLGDISGGFGGLGERTGVLESRVWGRSLRFLSSFSCFPPGIWDFHFPLRLVKQWSIPPASCGDLLPVQSPCRHPTRLTHLCILVSWGGKGWDQSEILEKELGNQSFLLLLLQEKATFSSPWPLPEPQLEISYLQLLSVPVAANLPLSEAEGTRAKGICHLCKVWESGFGLGCCHVFFFFFFFSSSYQQQFDCSLMLRCWAIYFALRIM